MKQEIKERKGNYLGGKIRSLKETLRANEECYNKQDVNHSKNSIVLPSEPS